MRFLFLPFSFRDGSCPTFLDSSSTEYVKEIRLHEPLATMEVKNSARHHGSIVTKGNFNVNMIHIHFFINVK